jgi:hypothetical protein
MGWIVMDRRPPGESHEVFFSRELLGAHQRIVASAHVGGIGGSFYAAVREGDEVWALVVLTTGCVGRRFGWKALTESMGPVEADCPVRILDLLTKTGSKEARDWRARCRRRAEQFAALTPDARITFDADYLTPAGPCRTFVVVDAAKALFKSNAGEVYRLRGWRSGTFTVKPAKA